MNIKIYICSICSKSADETETKYIFLERIKLACIFRNLNIPTMMSHLKNPKMSCQFGDVFNYKIPFMVIFGKDELKNNKLKIKNIKLKKEKVFETDIAIKFLTDPLSDWT